jgi:uncharacterized protein (TIGR02145 family)
MRPVKTFQLLLLMTSMTFASVRISGTVVDTSGTPVEGATVMLEQAGLSITTGADGGFMLSDAIGAVTAASWNQMPFNASIRNNTAFVTLSKKQKVGIDIFDLKGRLVKSVHKDLAPGTNAVGLPNTACGVFFYRLSAGSQCIVLKSVTAGNGTVSSCGVKTAPQYAPAKSLASFDDVIAVERNGYATYRMAVSTPDTSDVRLRIIGGAGSLTDADGNVYQTLRFGDYEWTIENLRTTKLNDGTPITLDSAAASWMKTRSAGYCFYGNTTDADSIKRFGALYNFFAVRSGKLAPSGWMVPTLALWDSLEAFLAASGLDKPNEVKSCASRIGWIHNNDANIVADNAALNNNSGLDLVPGGKRDRRDATYDIKGLMGCYWTSSEGMFAGSEPVNYCMLATNYFTALMSNPEYDTAGLSVRVMRKWVPVSAPVITVQPAPVTMTATGNPVTLTVSAVGNPTPAYQWRKNGTNISGAVYATLTIVSASVADNGSYTVVVSNSQGDVTSAAGLITVLDVGSMTDIEGTQYATVKIGSQEWMMENLRVTKLNDGTAITFDTVTADWSNTAKTSPMFCYCQNTVNADSIKRFGALYNWYTVNSGKLAPAGWHVPTMAEWDTLETYLIKNGYNWDGTREADKTAKSLAATICWSASTNAGAVGNDPTKNNSTGFSAMPAGYRRGSFGTFAGAGSYGYWWSADASSATMARYRYLAAASAEFLNDGDDKRCGMAVRLVKD